AGHPPQPDRRSRHRRYRVAVRAPPVAGAGGEHHPDRRVERSVRPVPGRERPGQRGLRAPSRRGQRLGGARHQRRSGGGRPPEPAGCRLQHRAAVAGPRRRGPDPRRADLVGGARRELHRAGEEQGPHELVGRDQRPDRCAVQPQHGALDLRHLHAGEVHRRRDGEGRRRHLVLPHRRLRFRPRPGARHHQLRARLRRAGAGRGADAVPGQRGLLLLPGAGAGFAREGGGPRQRRRRHHQLRQAGRGVRLGAPRREAGGAAGVHLRRPFAGPANGAGAGHHRDVLLGPERPHPRLHRPRRAEHAERAAAGHGPSRLLRRGDALPQGGGRHGRGGGQGLGHRGGLAHEGDALRRRRLRPRHDSRRRAQAAPGLPAGSEGTGGKPRSMGLLQAGGDHVRRRSVPPAWRRRLLAGPEL
ncbi:MAG: ABC transporter, substrate-binding protein (cluster 4, leucine/isoleucine/valine/benzoate), partial [uncultured Acetobacteraceae bacterium]